MSDGVVGIVGNGCDQLSAVGTTCEIVCAEGMWGGGLITCEEETLRGRKRKLLASSRYEYVSDTADRQRGLAYAYTQREKKYDGFYRNTASTNIMRLESGGSNLGSDRRRLNPSSSRDCEGSYLGSSVISGMKGDGTCDSYHTGSTYNLFCEYHDYDGGDCPENIYGME